MKHDAKDSRVDSATDAKISDETVKKIADDACSDERSVWKRLGGGSLRPKTAKRVDAAIAANLPHHRGARS